MKKQVLQILGIAALGAIFLSQNTNAQIDLGYRSAEGGKALGEWIFGKPAKATPLIQQPSLAHSFYKREIQVTDRESYFSDANLQDHDELVLQTKGIDNEDSLYEFIAERFALLAELKGAELSFLYNRDGDKQVKEVLIVVSGSEDAFPHLQSYAETNLEMRIEGLSPAEQAGESISNSDTHRAFGFRIPITSEAAIEALEMEKISSASKIIMGIEGSEDNTGYNLVIVYSTKGKVSSVTIPMLPMN